MTPRNIVRNHVGLRWIGLALLVGSIFLSGCLDEGTLRNVDDTDGTDGVPARGTSNRAPAAQAQRAVAGPLPPELHESEEVPFGMDVSNQVEGAPCASALSTCFKYPFSVKRENVIGGLPEADIVLTWTVASNDFDVYLYQGGAEVDRSADSVPGTSERIQLPLREGSYEVWVSAWSAAADTFELDLSWSRPGMAA